MHFFTTYQKISDKRNRGLCIYKNKRVVRFVKKEPDPLKFSLD